MGTKIRPVSQASHYNWRRRREEKRKCRAHCRAEGVIAKKQARAAYRHADVEWKRNSWGVGRRRLSVAAVGLSVIHRSPRFVSGKTGVVCVCFGVR